MASSQKSAWHIHWQIPLLMFGCFIASAGTAVGHHFLCDHLDGLPVINQTWNTRAGIALANIMKILLAASVTVSFTQQMWKTARSRFFSLKGVDSLFTASSNPFSLLDGEVLLHAKIAMLLALLIWVSPLITIIAPGSLGVTVHTTIQTNELSISTVNLSRSREDMSQSEQARAIDFTELTRITLDILPPGSGAQGYYRPSSRAIALIYQTVYGGRIADAISPCGSNCSFSQSFTAPAYKCSPVETEGAIPLYGSAWDVSRVEWYKAWNTTADFCDTMGGSASCNVFTGDEWIAGKIQVQYMYLPQSERELWEKNNTHPIAASAWQYSGFLCEQWFAQFDLQREYVNSVQQMNVTKTFLEPVKYGEAANELVSNRTYWNTVSMHRVLYSILSGRIGTNGRSAPQDSTNLGGSRLVEDVPFPVTDGIRKPRQNLSDLFEEVSANVSLSLLSVDGLVQLQPQADTAVDILTTTTVFQYNRQALWITYAVALGLGALSLVIGSVALLQNGVAMKGGFLAVLRTTRNPTLDEIARGQSLGSEPPAEDLARTRVKFGRLGEAMYPAGMVSMGTMVNSALEKTPSVSQNFGFGVKDRDIVGAI